MCDNRTWIFLQYQTEATTKLRTMLKCYLWLTVCLQFALINGASAASAASATKTRRANGNGGGVLSALDAQEHVHIKVHLPEVSRSRARSPSHRTHHAQHEKPKVQRSPSYNKRVLPTLPTHSFSSSGSGSSSSSSKEIPYEFDFFGLNNEDNSLATGDLMHASKYGPVVFTSNIQSGTSQQPMSQQFMRQFFTPEIMSALKADNDDNGYAVKYRLMHEPETAFDDTDMMQEYFEKLNQPKSERSTAAAHSQKLAHKRKKYGNTGIGESYPKESLQQQFYNTVLREHSKPIATTKQRKTNAQQQQQRYQQRQHEKQQQQFAPFLMHDNFKAYQQDFEDDDAVSLSTSDELEAVENVSASTSASMEDMAAAYNRLKPISYQDMYGEYATPISAATTSSSSAEGTATNRHLQQQDFSLHHETIPTYRSTITTPYTTANNWLQQYQPLQQQQQPQRPEKQQQILYKPQQQQQHQEHQQQQQQQQPSKKHKPKSQQTQFVLQPTLFGLASSPSSSTSLSSSALSTSPISSSSGSGFGGASNSIESSYSSTWSIPYDFVEQSHRQQLATQQQPQQHKKQQQQQHQRPDYKPTAYKKRKNRTKRKRNRIIVE